MKHLTMKFFALSTASLTAALGIVACSAEAETYTDVQFDSTKRYSQLLIDSRINDFYANTKKMGFTTYDEDGNVLKKNAGGSNLKFDYVPGLVAKAVIEGAEYYQDSAFARPWFYMVQDYANRFVSSVPTTGGSLDNLNATKMYCTLYDLTGEDGAFASIADASTHSNAEKAMQNAIKGLRDANNNYAITLAMSQIAAGGWWHKSSYPNQMWCDGQYMGPALLAQLQRYGYHIGDDDWRTIMRQFDITWHYLWDDEKQLLWHAFSANPTSAESVCWADPNTCRSAEYWGRAAGWYFLALVDILELIPTDIVMEPTQSSLANYSPDCRTRLKQYLELVAGGLKARQDETSGCWYQLLQYDSTFVADKYAGKSYTPTSNYLESSATAIFVASYLKAIRLGLLSADDYLETALQGYEGFVNQFVKMKADGTYTLVNSCASAGLGGSANRDGSAAYYLLGSDVTRVTNYTEGKVLGAFILAAVEYERLRDLNASTEEEDENTGLTNAIGQEKTTRPTKARYYTLGGIPVEKSAISGGLHVVRR
ncbi:MAG: glycoside hydrolase family 88 protein [Bacteroidales bacterium]|nr:glycoside hydrolase family 88 protein [Bacteroidales bacterium]